MLTPTTQSRLATVVRSLAKAEVQVEQRRRILAEQQLFEPSTAFKRLDQGRQGQLQLQDLVEFLDDNRVPYTQTETAYLFKKLDDDHDGRISYHDFQRAVLPKTDNVLKQAATIRQPYHIDIGMLLPNEVELALSQFLGQHLANYRTVNQSKQALVSSLDYNSLEAFRSLDLFNQGYLSVESLETFQRAQGQPITTEELVHFFKAVDLDEDNRISYQELVEAVHLMEPLPYAPAHQSIIKQYEIERALEKSRSLEHIYLTSYPYYFYPYYPYYYPSFFPYLRMADLRVRENSLDRLRRSRLAQVDTEKRIQSIEHERQGSLERQRSLERLRQIEDEHRLRSSQIAESDKIRELDRLRNDELRRSREQIRQIETVHHIKQAETDAHLRNLAREHHHLAVERESQARIIDEERRLLEAEARYRSLERLGSIERLTYLENLRRVDAENVLFRYYNHPHVRYPYQIIDSINAFGYNYPSHPRLRHPTRLTRSAIYDSPQKSANPYSSVLKSSIEPRITSSKISYESQQSGIRRALV